MRAKLTLVMPPSIPEFEEWEQWLASHPPENGISRLLLEASAIQDSRTDILFIHAKRGDAGAMREVLDQTHKRFGALHGVIHTVSLGREATEVPIREVYSEECEWQLKEKRQELLVLEEVLRDRQIDFCLLVSSLAPIGGGRSQSLNLRPRTS